MYYVYIISSGSSSEQTYVGVTTNLKKRLGEHNAGQSPHTSKYCPWNLAFYAAFPEKLKAYEFEAYLKSHSGKAFLRKRLL